MRQLLDVELLGELRCVRREANLLYARTLALIAEIDSRGLVGKEGYGSTVELVRDAQNLTKAQARQRLNAAHDLIAVVSPSGAQVPSRLLHTAAALRAGQVNEAQVAVIRAVLAAIPPHAEQHRPTVEQRLAANAHLLDAGQLRLLGKRELAYLEQDGKPPTDDRELPARSLTMRDLPSGNGVRGEFVLGQEGAAALQAPLSPLAAPRPATDGEPDRRTFEQRSADALVELATRALNLGDLPTEGGEKPHVTVTITYDALLRQITSAWLDGAGPISPEAARRYGCDASATPGSFRSCWAVGRNHSTSAAEAMWCRHHCVAPWCDATAAAHTQVTALWLYGSHEDADTERHVLVNGMLRQLLRGPQAAARSGRQALGLRLQLPHPWPIAG